MDPTASYVYGISFGQLLPVRTVNCHQITISMQGWAGIDEGWIFGEWETGPWLGFDFVCLLRFIQILIYSHRLGFRSTKKEKGSYSWLGFGDGTGGDHMVKTSFLGQ